MNRVELLKLLNKLMKNQKERKQCVDKNHKFNVNVIKLGEEEISYKYELTYEELISTKEWLIVSPVTDVKIKIDNDPVVRTLLEIDENYISYKYDQHQLNYFIDKANPAPDERSPKYRDCSPYDRVKPRNFKRDNLDFIRLTFTVILLPFEYADSFLYKENILDYRLYSCLEKFKSTTFHENDYLKAIEYIEDNHKKISKKYGLKFTSYHELLEDVIAYLIGHKIRIKKGCVKDCLVIEKI